MPHLPLNPYLVWLASSGSPPFPVRLPEARAAGHTLVRRAAARLRALLEQPTVARYLAYEDALAQGHALSGWLDQAGPHSGKVERSSLKAQVDALDAQLVRLQARRQTQGRRALQRLMRHAQTPAGLRATLRRELAYPHPGPQAHARLTRLRRAHQARVEAQAPGAGVHLPTTDSLAFLPTRLRREGRLAARARGLSGAWFTPGDEGHGQVLSYHPDPMVRHAAWQGLQDQASTVDHLEAVRLAREALTGVPVAQTALAYNAALHDGASVERSMMRGAQSLRRAIDRFVRRQYATQGHPMPEPAMAWDQAHQDHQMGLPESPELSPDIFPWEATVRLALPELMGCDGWRLEHEPVRMETDHRVVLRFAFHHAERGRQVDVWYSPFDPNPTPDAYAGAWVRSIRGAWASHHQPKPVLWVAQTLDPNVPAFTVDHLEYLAHEVGHVLHYLSFPGLQPGEEDAIAQDIGEFPAYLLQLYARDPKVLARWAHREGPKAAHRARYWAKFLVHSPYEPFGLREHLANAWTDLYVHRHSAHVISYPEARDRMMAGSGQAQTPAHGAYWQGFLWEDDFAAQDYTQIMGQALAHRLVHQQPHGQTDAPAIARLYREALGRVLAHASAPHRLNLAWRQWLGEGLRTSWSKGLEALVRHQRQVLRHHTR